MPLLSYKYHADCATGATVIVMCEKKQKQAEQKVTSVAAHLLTNGVRQRKHDDKEQLSYTNMKKATY